MKLGWIYHKAQCGRPLDRFFVPPLSDDDKHMIRMTKETPFRTSDHVKDASLTAHLKKIGLWDGELEPLLDSLALPADNHPIQEPRRSILLSYVRHHLSLHIADRRPISHRHAQGSFAFRRDSVWRHMGLHVVHLLDDPGHRGYPSWDDDIFTTQNDYLRKTTALFALFVWVEPPPGPSALTLEVIDKALGRKADAISAAPGDLETKRLLRKLHEGSTRTAGQVKGLTQMMRH
ncbi:hypothetical protein JCM11641_000994 [Rhodosporidiobolus odoratus]